MNVNPSTTFYIFVTHYHITAMKKILFLILMIMPFLVKANHWQPDPYQYESNMTVTGVLHFDDIEQRRESIEIGAFYDGVCRGSSMIQYIESLHKPLTMTRL